MPPDRHRPPTSLLCLLGAIWLLGAGWALIVPPWQSPDENSHFGYAQQVAERFELPGDSSRPPFSTEQVLAQARSNADQTAARRAAKPEWSEVAYHRWHTADEMLPDSARRDGGGPNPASTNPPLYYLYEAPAYAAASGGDVFDRLYLMRWWSMLLLLVTATGAWLLAGELFARDRLLQLVAAALVGLQPMATFISASVNPDALLWALWSIALWLGVRLIKHGLSAPDAIGLLGAVGLGVATKATGYALVPAALIALAVASARTTPLRGRRTAVLVTVGALLAFAVPAGGWLVTARALDRPAVNQVATGDRPAPTLTSFDVRTLGSYLWQFYLPRLPFQREFGALPERPVFDVWLKGGWAAFGWLEVTFPQWMYVLLAALTVAILAGTVTAVARAWRRIDAWVVAFFGLAALALLAGLHWTEFRTLEGGIGPFNQGRYLLPLLSLMGCAAAAALSTVPARLRGTVAGAFVGSLVALQLASLAIVGARFYA